MKQPRELDPKSRHSRQTLPRPQDRPTRLRRQCEHRMSYHLGILRSTVERVLTRYRMPKLAHLDQTTGLPVCKPISVRYEK